MIALAVSSLVADRLAGRHRSGVGLDNVDRHRGRAALFQTVEDAILEVSVHGDASVVDVGERAVGVEGQQALRGPVAGGPGVSNVGDQLGGEGIGVGVGVVGQHARGDVDHQRAAANDGIGVVLLLRGRVDGDLDRRVGGQPERVGHPVGERVEPVIAGGRLIGERAVGGQTRHQRAVRRPGEQRRGQRIAVGVHVVQQHALVALIERAVDGDGIGIVDAPRLEVGQQRPGKEPRPATSSDLCPRAGPPCDATTAHCRPSSDTNCRRTALRRQGCGRQSFRLPADGPSFPA